MIAQHTLACNYMYGLKIMDSNSVGQYFDNAKIIVSCNFGCDQ